MTLDEARRQTLLLSNNPNPVTRNRDISEAYARIYMANETIRWAGMAAYVSNHVGCVMKSWIQGTFTRWFLGQGNKLVFEDVHPVLFYFFHLVQANQPSLRSDLEKLKFNGRVSPKVASALFNLKYQPTERSVRERESADRILEHEQSSILQERVFNSALVNGMCFLAGLISHLWPHLLTVKFHSSCQQNDPNFLIHPGRGINYADYDQRWEFAKRVAERFHSLHESPRVNLIRMHLGDMVTQNGGSPSTPRSRIS